VAAGERREFRRIALVLLFAVFLPTGVLAMISVVAQQRESAFLLTEARENALLVAHTLMGRIESALIAEEGRVRRDFNVFCPEEADIPRLTDFISEMTKRHPLVSSPLLISEDGRVLYPISPFGASETRIPERPFGVEWEQEDVEKQRRITEAQVRLSRIARGVSNVDEAIRECLDIATEIDSDELKALARFLIARLSLIRGDKEGAGKELQLVFDASGEAAIDGVPLSVEARVVYIEQKFPDKNGAEKLIKEAYKFSVEHPEKFSDYEVFERLLERLDKNLAFYGIKEDDELKRLKLMRKAIEEIEERIARVHGDFMPIFREYLQSPDNYSPRECHIRRQIGAKTKTFAYFVLGQRMLIKNQKMRVIFSYVLNPARLEEIVQSTVATIEMQPEITMSFIVGGKVSTTIGDKKNITPELLVGAAETAHPLPPISSEVYSSHIGSVRSWMFGRSLVNFLLVSLLVVVSGVGVLFLIRGIRREIEFVKMRSQFISSVTHELKTPLTSIRMLAETIQLGRISDPKRLSEYMEVIAAESERLSRLITNVLDFARIEEGRKEYSFEVVDLREIARRAVSVFAYYVHYAGFVIEFSFSEKPVLVWGDKEALEQVALNILSNAIKYSGDDKWVGVRVLLEQKNGVIEIEDHGVGIPESEIEQIFERFYRSSITAGTYRTGTGIGLSLVKSIVEAHNGIIEVDSEVGKGSIFRVVLPIFEEIEDGEGSGSGGRVVNSDGDEGQSSDGGLRGGNSDGRRKST